jgi:dTMP kinase
MNAADSTTRHAATSTAFITFEGIEGSGKTTQIERLGVRLRQTGLDVVVTREPGGTDLGRDLRGVLLRPTDQPMAAETELLLYTADRVQHLREIVEPALARGALVLCDRYLDATIAYQGHARGLDIDWILELHRHPPLNRRPDLTLLFDLDPSVALARARGRNAGAGLEDSEGRFENEELDFHQKVRAGYLELAERDPGRIKIIDAQGTLDEIEARVEQQLNDRFPWPGAQQ